MATLQCEVIYNGNTAFGIGIELYDMFRLCLNERPVVDDVGWRIISALFCGEDLYEVKFVFCKDTIALDKQ